MPQPKELERVLGSMEDEDLREALVELGLPPGGLNTDRVGRLLNAVLTSRVTFEDILLLGAVSKDALQRMCLASSRPKSGNIDDLIDRLLDWYWEDAEEEPEEFDLEPDDEPLEFRFDRTKAVESPHPYQRQVTEELRKRTERGAAGKKLLVCVATGGGKTRIVNDWIGKHVLGGSRRVLWVTKDWELLAQAASDLGRRFEGAAGKLGRVSGGQERIAVLPETASARVVYTTIHTWARRTSRDFRMQDFDFVVIDEVHWGENAPMYRRLQKRYGATSCLVGLTATPREATGYEPICSGLDFPDLVRMGHLARPIQLRVPTGLSWAPDRSVARGDFTPSSLGELALSAARNKLVVETLRNGREKFGKTIVFACNIEHAKRLRSDFERVGIATEVLHSKMERDDRRAALERFRTKPGEQRSAVDVLVNVAMLTHGVDIPDIETVFLVRPTASDVLFSQMVGRGARRVEGRKERFHVVDFVDNLQRHGDVLVTAGRFFGPDEEMRTVHPQAATRRRAPTRHSYEPAEILVYPGRPGYEALTGLEIQPKMTFGLEFELTRSDYTGDKPRDWKPVAERLRAALARVVPTADRVYEAYGSDKDYQFWNVEFDRSCGWEVTSRILGGTEGAHFEDGLEEVADAARAIEDAAAEVGLKVNHATGTHVHLAWKPTPDQMKRLMSVVAHFEPALYSLVSPSRHNNRYCLSVRSQLGALRGLWKFEHWQAHFAQPDSRYISVNPQNLLLHGGLGTLEIRLHNGTIEGPKILTWMSLWMRLLHAIDKGGDAPPRGDLSTGQLPLCAGAQGDIEAMARHLNLGPQLTAMLKRRREQALESWLNSIYGDLARQVGATWGKSSAGPAVGPSQPRLETAEIGAPLESSRRELLRRQLEERGLEVVSRPDTALWVVGGKNLERQLQPIADLHDLAFAWAPEGGRLTRRRPGWYINAAALDDE